MFNFSVVLPGHDKVTETGRVNTCRRNFRAPSLQSEVTKSEGNSENMGFNGKTIWRFETKKYNFSFDQTAPGTTPLVYVTIEDGACSQEKLNWRKTEKKFFRLKLLEFCNARTKKSSPDKFNFYVFLAGQYMVTDVAGLPRAGTNSKLVITNIGTKNEGNSENMFFNGKLIWGFWTNKTHTCSFDQTILWNT